MNKLYVIMAMLVLMGGVAEGKNLNLTFNCTPGNDLYTALSKSGAKCPRFDTASEAVERAAPGSAALILADGYPDTTTTVDSAVLDKTAKKKLRLYVEYPAAIPGLQIGAPRGTLRRAPTNSDVHCLAEYDREDAPFADFAFHGDNAAVSFHNIFHN